MSGKVNQVEVNETVETVQVEFNAPYVRDMAQAAREFVELNGKLSRDAILHVAGVNVPVTVEALTSLLAEDYAGILQSGALTELAKASMKLSETERENVRLLTETLLASLELIALAVTVNKPKQQKASSDATTKARQEEAKLASVLSAVAKLSEAFENAEEVVPPSGK